MNTDALTKYFFIGLLVILSYLTFLMVKPFIAYLIMAVILTYFTYPLYERLLEKIPRKGLAAATMIVIIILLLIIPTVLVVKTLINQSSTALNAIHGSVGDGLSEFLSGIGIEGAEVDSIVQDMLNRLSSFIVNSASGVVGSLAEITIGMFILFFLMYYGFKEGSTLYQIIVDHIPLKPTHKNKLIKEVNTVSYAVLYGQVMTAIIQGAVAGVGFLIFGVPNAVFWGFIMIILSFLPIIGTPIVWGPAALILLAQEKYVSGIGLLIFGVIVVMNIDNFLKPILISDKAKIHPVLILLGVLGGLSVFGFAGIVLGPLIMALLITMLKFYTEEKTFVI